MEDKKTVYLTMHKNFVREGIEYEDRKTGETKAFNVVTLPKDTVLDGQDLSYYEFSPLFVNQARFMGEDYRDIPLQAHKEVWLKKTVMGEDGKPLTDADGKVVRDTVKVAPAALKEAVDQGRSRYLMSLGERAENARESSRVAGGMQAPARGGRESMARDDIPF